MTIQTLNNYVLRKPVMRISLLLFSIVALAFILRPAQLSALAIAAEPDRSIAQAAEEKTNPTAENAETKADAEKDKKKAQQEEEEKRLQKINDENYALYELLIDTIDQVEEYYVKPIDKKELIQAAIDGVLRKLDPHSVYIPDDAVDEFKTDIENRFGGIGINYEKKRDKFVVVTPLADSPAYRAGIRPDDIIVAINGIPTKDMTMDEASEKMSGPIGSRLTLTIKRKKKEPFDVTVTRDLINLPTISGCSRNADDSWNYWIDVPNKIAYVRISSFSHKTSEELKTVLKQLTDDGMRGLLLDLRFNPGGALAAAIEVCDMFIDGGAIVSIKGRATDEKTWFASKGKTITNVPMAVLINQYSASASETVSSCLQDHNRAKIVGERSFGKGSVQNVIDVKGGALKLTTSGYYRPNGKNIHREPGFTEEDEWGVTPDIVVKLNSYQSEKILWRYQFLDILLNPEKDDEGTPIVPPVRAGEENRTAPVIDPQIARALQWITSGK